MIKPKQNNLPGFDIPTSSRCRICNRPLRAPESVAAGIGPTCSGSQKRRSILMPSLLRQEHHSDYSEMLNMAADEIVRLNNLLRDRK